MNKQNVARFVKNAQVVVAKHTPEILTGLGIAGMITSTVFAVKATPKALALIEMEKEQKQVEELTPVEVVKTTWKCYVPSAVMCTASVACLIGATTVNAKRTAALATAYKLSEAALTEYREKVVETIGEKKEQSIREAVAEDKVKKNPVPSSGIIITERGNTLCLDPLSQRYFKSDIERIKRAENELNKRMLHDMFGYVSVNDLYDELGLEHTDVGDDLGWNVNQLIDIDFSSHIASNNEPCVVLEYRVAPRYNYSTIM